MVEQMARYDTRDDAPLGVIAESARSALAARRPAQALELMAISVAQAGPWDAAAIAVVGAAGAVITAASSDERARSAQARQQDVRQGPSCEAVAGNSMIAVDDVSLDPRWPLWGPTAADLGIAAALAVPLFTGSTLGVVTFYGRSPRRWNTDDVQRADLVGAHVSVVVAHAVMQQNLWRAIDGRTVIGQAQGMLMERYRLTADQAFALLRRYSQQQNTKLAVLAHHLVQGGTLGDLPAGGVSAGRTPMIDDRRPEGR